MTPRQKRLIRETFPTLHEVAEPLVQLFYGRLFQIAPSVRPMFRNDMGTQTRKFSDMLEALVEGLDDLDQKRQALRAMGLRHSPRHFCGRSATCSTPSFHLRSKTPGPP
jgi:hemoglobin-like flavoprotein